MVRCFASLCILLLFVTHPHVVWSQDEESTLGEPDQSLPEENQAWVEHARATGFALSSLTASDFPDLQFLPEVIGERRLVQLGESAHEVAEFSAAKVRLIRFLHEEMGFNVIAFESSLFECQMAEEQADDLSADDLMRSCIFGIWYTEETIPLFEYILETRATDRPLRLAGFDIQVSSRTWRQRPGFWHAVISPLDLDYAEEVALMDSTFLAIRFQASDLAAQADDLVDRYQDLSRFLQERQADLVQAGVDQDDVRLAFRLSESTSQYIQQLMAPPGAEFTLARDKGMADNLLWLMEEFYPNEKIITWGHNFHLRHHNEAVAPNPVKTMGQWIAETHRDDMYTVGVYMRRGRGAMNGQAFNVVAPSSGSLESILGHVGEPYLFIDLRRTAEGQAGEWVRRPIVTKTWGQADVTMTLLDQYDALLFIDQVNLPTYR